MLENNEKKPVRLMPEEYAAPRPRELPEPNPFGLEGQSSQREMPSHHDDSPVRELPSSNLLPTSDYKKELPNLPTLGSDDGSTRQIPGASQADLPSSSSQGGSDRHGVESKLVEVMGELVKALKTFKEGMPQQGKEAGPQKDGSFVPSLTPRQGGNTQIGGNQAISESIMRDMRQRSQADRGIAMMRGS